MYKNITIVVSTRSITNSDYADHLIKTSGNPNVEVMIRRNNNEFSLAQLYNICLKEAKNEIVVFCHDDLIFETPNWASKILSHFNKKEKYGIIGVAGTNKLTSGTWWEHRNRMYGIVNHQHEGRKHTNHYSIGFGKNIKPVVIVDGLFMAVNREVIVKGFNERFPGFHFYDLPFCLENYLAGVKVGVVTDIRLTHLSIGEVNQSWYNNKKLFEIIYKDHLPNEIIT